MLRGSDADDLFEDCSQELTKAVTLADDCVAKAQNGRGHSTTDTPKSLERGATNELATALQQWRRELTIEDVLQRLHTVVAGVHRSPPTGVANPQAKKLWSGVMKKLVAALDATALTLCPTAPHSSRPPTSLTYDVERLLVSVLKYVWLAALVQLSHAAPTLEDRRDVPILQWLCDTARVAACLTTGRRAHTAASMFSDSTPGAAMLMTLVHAARAPDLQLPQGPPLVLAGYGSLVRAVATYSPHEVRHRVLVREPILDTFASKLRTLFLEGTEATNTVCFNAVASIVFVARSCEGAECRTFIREAWVAILGALEASCIGRGVAVQASRRGLAAFVHATLYVPIFGAVPEDQRNVDNADDATALTAEYRLLRLIGDLGESELHALSSSGAVDDLPTPPAAHQELHRAKYKALLDNSNGVLTLDIVSQLVHDRGIMIEATTSRSATGHVVHRMFLPDASTANASVGATRGGAGRLAKFQGKQQWVYVEKGNLYVKRQGAATYSIVASIDELMQPFQ